MQALTGLVAMALAAGLALPPVARAGDDSAILKIMEEVNTRNRAIGKGLRVSFAPEPADRKTLAAHAASLVQLGKEARTLTGPARERNKSQPEWTRSVDAFLRASEGFARVIAEPGLSQARAKQSYQNIQKTCINCHSTFREEAD
jgi:hypothetical protein